MYVKMVLVVTKTNVKNAFVLENTRKSLFCSLLVTYIQFVRCKNIFKHLPKMNADFTFLQFNVGLMNVNIY